MATETHLAIQQICLQQWAEMVRECNSRLRGMKVIDWCREYGITKYDYYYRLNHVRKSCLDAVQTETERKRIVFLYIIIFKNFCILCPILGLYMVYV